MGSLTWSFPATKLSSVRPTLSRREKEVLLYSRTTDAVSTRPASPSIERRAYRRSRAEQLRLTFLGADHLPLNWSESGALIEDRHPDLEVGTVIKGVLIFGPNSVRYRFSAELVRRDGIAKQ